MYMVNDMNEAWSDMKNYSNEKNQEYVRNLLSHTYVLMDDAWKELSRKNRQTYDDNAFYIFQKILVQFMLCDNEFLQSEYDCYCKFCLDAHFKPLTVDACKSLYNRTSIEELARNIAFVCSLRSAIGEREFHAMVRGFCHFCLLSDHKMDENEYYILACFYNSSEKPATWAQFKKEWVVK